MQSVLVFQICVLALLLPWAVVNSDDCGVVRGDRSRKKVRTPDSWINKPGERRDVGGQYCSKREDPCCPSRNDECTAPITVPGLPMDHLCYCDKFCNRESTNEGNDCCPDYAEVCLSAFSTGEEQSIPSREGRSRSESGHSEPAHLPTNTAPPSAVGHAQDVTTVALLLDYQYNSSRLWSSLSPGLKVKFDKSKYISYCVHYELVRVYKHCEHTRWKSTLYRKNVICAECQPLAQLHGNDFRCASDLEDGEEGFWKLIGPRNCYGEWRRMYRSDNCKCFEKYPMYDPFLMV